MDAKKVGEFVRSFLTWFAIFYLIFWAVSYFAEPSKQNTEQSALEITLKDKSPVMGHLAQFTFVNRSESVVKVDSLCDESGNMTLSRVVNGEKLSLSKALEKCREGLTSGFEVPAGQSYSFAFPHLNHDLFSEPGKYELSILVEDQEVRSGILEYEEPGVFRQLFRALILKPLFNLLAFFTDVLPHHSFGGAIILLTIVVRILLFKPNQKAMKSQRKLQKLQPKMEEIRKKYGSNQQTMALKTMELYKTHKINPMSSCLPLLAQMPFLIGIYFVALDGLAPHLSHLFYGFNADFDLTTVNNDFLGMDLSVPNIWVLPFLVAGAQFIAMKLSFSAMPQNTPTKNSGTPDMAAQMAQMQKIMIWVLPVMIGVFTATFPAAVGLYWLTSTVFGIGQQKLVNYQLDQNPEVTRKAS